jgi:uncharacterized DUF497 family protein
MDFEWDDTKDEVNYKKHAIRFAEAVSLWSDCFSLDYYDVIHSEELIRIISARKATKLEVLEYEK